MDVSENSGAPKSSIWIGISSMNHPFWGTPIFGNTHMTICVINPTSLGGSFWRNSVTSHWDLQVSAPLFRDVETSKSTRTCGCPDCLNMSRISLEDSKLLNLLAFPGVYWDGFVGWFFVGLVYDSRIFQNMFFVHLFLLQDLIASDTNDLDESIGVGGHLLMFEVFWISPKKNLGA